MMDWLTGRPHEELPIQSEPELQSANPYAGVVQKLVQVTPKIIVPAYPNSKNPMTPQQGDRKYLVFHHTAGSINQTPLEIDAEERNVGYSYIPYSYLVDHLGNIYQGRPLQFMEEATYGAHPLSVSVCAIGNYQHDDPGYSGPPTKELIQGLTDIGIYLHQQIKTIELTTWHDWIAENVSQPSYSTACCGDMLEGQILGIKQAIHKAIGK